MQINFMNDQSFILSQLEQQANHIIGSARKTSPKVLFLHYLTGSVSNPYLLRRSAVRVSVDAGLTKIAEYAKSQRNYSGDLGMLHRIALGEYIKYLDRDNTFLHMAINSLKKRLILQVPLIGQLTIKEHSKKRMYLLTNKRKSNTEHQSMIFDWIMSPEAASALAPAECISEFFKELYLDACDQINLQNKESTIKQTWRENFQLARSHVFGMGLAERETMSPWNKELNKRRQTWEQLAAAQSALMYFRANINYNPGDKKCADSCSILVHAETDDKYVGSINDKPLHLAVAIMSPAIQSDDLDAVNAILRDLLYNVRRLSDSAKQRYWIVEKCLKQPDNSKFDTSVDLKSNAPPSYKEAVKLLSAWQLLIAKQLDTSKHEGNPLDFYFVVGEQSEFEDNANTRLRLFCTEKNADTNNKQCDINVAQFAIPEFDNESYEHVNAMTLAAEVAAKTLSHEHYPWFEKGRHALFWDISREKGTTPTGLVTLNDSNWGQLVDDGLRERTKVKIPSCLLAYVNGSHACAGLIRITGTEVKELFRWKGGKWQLYGSEDLRMKILNDHLPYVLPQLGNCEQKEVRKDTIDIVKRLADDPNKGGIIVFMKEYGGLKLHAMGKPWRLQDRLDTDDLVALIGHDGATIRKIGDKSWDHRHLLTPETSQAELLDMFESHVKKQRGKWPLEYVGSRRWNAALMACHKNVEAVIVVSQDGDIHVWSVKEAENTFNLFMLELKATGDNVVPLQVRINKIHNPTVNNSQRKSKETFEVKGK
jgi:hypothetical protein